MDITDQNAVAAQTAIANAWAAARSGEVVPAPGDVIAYVDVHGDQQAGTVLWYGCFLNGQDCRFNVHVQNATTQDGIWPTDNITISGITRKKA